MTKQFTAAAILKLQMIGRLRVADPIDRFIDRVPRDKRAITIADLFDQTSGLTDSPGDDYEPLSRGRIPGRRCARGYRRGRPVGTRLERPWAQGGPYWNLRGNRGILSTARDMLRRHRALLGDAVLSGAAKRELFAPRVPEGPEESYAH